MADLIHLHCQRISRI